jgi:hypothetical protein
MFKNFVRKCVEKIYKVGFLEGSGVPVLYIGLTVPCTFCPHCIYVFCIYLRTNSDLCHLQRKLIGFYNRDEKCLQRCTDRAFE